MLSLHFVPALTIGILFSIFMFMMMVVVAGVVVILMMVMKCQFFLLAGDLSCYNYKKKNPGTLCCLLVDSGYSFTHIVPYIKGKKLKQGIRRIDVGGKMLTNHLKEIISYRYCELSKFTWTV
jgi:actin-related protein 6